MHHFKRKRMIYETVFSYGTIAILVVLVGFMSVSVFKRYQVEREMSERREETEAEIRELRQRAAALEAKVEYLQDERGIEAEIRGRFDVAKEGEQVVIILDDARDTDDIMPVVAPVSEESERPWYKFW